MNKNIFTHFSKTINDYDTVANKVVMKNDEFHNFLSSAIPFDVNKNLKILDLGCGTGYGMDIILKKFPNSKITGIDYSNIMISKSSEKLKDFKNRFELINGDFNKIQIDKGFDVIVSAIAIHNSSHSEKKILFQKIYDSLNKGGVFLNADFIEGEFLEQEKFYNLIYKSFLEKNLKGDELKVWIKHAFKEDMPMKLSTQFEILKNIGFSKTEIILQFNKQALYIAKK